MRSTQLLKRAQKPKNLVSHMEFGYQNALKSANTHFFRHVEFWTTARWFDGDERITRTEGAIHKSTETHAPPSSGCAASSSCRRHYTAEVICPSM